MARSLSAIVAAMFLSQQATGLLPEQRASCAETGAAPLSSNVSPEKCQRGVRGGHPLYL